MKTRYVVGLLVGLALAGQTDGAFAGSDLDKAIKAGATPLTAEEIAERFTNKTATFVSAKDGVTFLIYYGADNAAAGSKVGGGWSASGFHAVTDRDQICLGWEGRDLPKLRCMDVVLIDGVVHKFTADGSLSGKITNFAEGNTT